MAPDAPSLNFSRMFGVSFVLIDKLQCGGIDAIAQTCGARPIGKDVSEVRVTAAAEDFLAHHAVASVSLDIDVLFTERRIETRPS